MTAMSVVLGAIALSDAAEAAVAREALAARGCEVAALVLLTSPHARVREAAEGALARLADERGVPWTARALMALKRGVRR